MVDPPGIRTLISRVQAGDSPIELAAHCTGFFQRHLAGTRLISFLILIALVADFDLQVVTLVQLKHLEGFVHERKEDFFPGVATKAAPLAQGHNRQLPVDDALDFTV